MQLFPYPQDRLVSPGVLNRTDPLFANDDHRIAPDPQQKVGQNAFQQVYPAHQQGSQQVVRDETFGEEGVDGSLGVDIEAPFLGESALEPFVVMGVGVQRRTIRAGRGRVVVSRCPKGRPFVPEAV